MYDVIVIGGGPTGSLCSYNLSKAGLNVALIEKIQFPRVKLCGGGISYKACQILKDVIDLDKLKGRAINGSFLSYKNEHLTYVEQDVKGYSVERKEMDYELLKAAGRVGTKIFMPSEVVSVAEDSDKVNIVLKNGELLESGFIVFAEGINGQIHMQIGYNGQKIITMALEVDVYPKQFPESFSNNALFDFGAIPGGYGWVFPKKNYLNAGAYFYNSPKSTSSQINSLEIFLNQFEWAQDAKIEKIRGHPVPYNIKYKMYNTNRSLLVGDISGAVENFYGEGLFYGLSSALLASDSLINKIRKNISLDSYTSALKSKILNQIKYSRITSNIFYNNRKFGYYRMVRNKLMNYLFAGLIHGKFSQKKCFYYTALSLPFSFFSKSLKDADFDEIGLKRSALYPVM